MSIAGFDCHPRTRLIFGVDAVDRLGELARELGVHRTLIVTDAGVIAGGHLDRARRALDSAGLAVTVFDRVRENPTAVDVDECATSAREIDPKGQLDCIVGLGGGSCIDTARGLNFVLTNGGRMQDYWGYGKATRQMLPLIAVPTTAGTGSECQSYALIADEKTRRKMACGDPKAAAAIAVLDPTLTRSQPRLVTASAGLDALVHAVETAVTRKRNALSWLYSREAFRLTIDALPRLLAHPDDLELRARMQLGAAYAGTAIELSMLGAAHSAANPLTARFGVNHGQAVGRMLPHVVRFNAGEPEARDGYRGLMAAAGLVEEGFEPADALAARLESLLVVAKLPSSLAAHGVTAEAIPRLAADAAAEWTAQFNPRAVSAADFETFYREALENEEARIA